MNARSEPIGLNAVISANVASRRHVLGLTQDQLAQRCASRGLEWTRSVIASIEAGNRRLNVDELLLLGASLDIAPIQLLHSDAELVRIGATVYPGRDVRPLMTARPHAAWDREASAADVVADLRRIGLGSAEQKAAARLRLESGQVAEIARRLFGHGLTEERDARAPEGASKQQRAAITAKLINEHLKPAAIEAGYINEESQE